MTNTKEKASPAETGGLVRCPHCRSVILHSEIHCSGTFGGSAEVKAFCLRCRKHVLYGYVDEWLTRRGREAGPHLNGALPALVAEDVRRGRLIAAAPELLEALLAIVTECADPGSPFYSPEPPFGGDSYLPRKFVDRAEAALAKALGKEVRK